MTFQLASQKFAGIFFFKAGVFFLLISIMNYEHVNYTTQMFMFLNEKFKLDNRVDTIVQFEYIYMTSK